MLHELAGVRENLDADDVSRARKGLARVKHIFRTLTDQWSVLATLTPSEYAEFRGVLGNSSGFQSHQYRAVEFILGNKNQALLAVFAGPVIGEVSVRGDRRCSPPVSVPARYAKHMMVVADLAGGDVGAIEDALEKAWQLQRDAG